MLARRSVAGASRIQRRLASTNHKNHHHPAEDVHYAKEPGFNTPAWRNTIILGILATVAYKYAPEPGEENSVTKWIRESATTEERLLDVNAGHSAQQAQVSHINRVAAKARRPLVYRTQNPGQFENYSPFAHPVGGMSVEENYVIKRE